MMYFAFLLIFVLPVFETKLTRRVIGGIGAFDEAPWMVALLNPEPFCGGAVITEFYVQI